MGAVLLEELRTFTARLQCAEAASGDPGLGIDLLDAIETLKSVGCAVQAVITDDVATQIRADRKAAGLPRVEWGRGIASQIALARRESPNRGGRATRREFYLSSAGDGLQPRCRQDRGGHGYLERHGRGAAPAWPLIRQWP